MGFYGMSSATAMNKHVGGVSEYRASEGKTVEVPYRGDAEATILDILGGLRSACTYTGASRLKELPKRTTFIRCPTDERDLQRVRSRRRLKTFSSLSLFLSFCFLSDSGMLETDSTVNFSISAVFLVWDFFAMFN